MSTKAKVIFVNSFKGGAGKTTLALTHCIDNLFHETNYENTVYIDLDVLGTGTAYLFGEGVLPETSSFDKEEALVEVPLELNKVKGSLYMAYLDPAMKIRSVYGNSYFVNHQGIAEEAQKERVLNLIRSQIKQEQNTLFVIDCAPGFSKLEQSILTECYEMMLKKKLEVEEEYVTTLDSAHIQKFIQCLNDSADGFSTPAAYRSIRLIINDMQNYTEYLTQDSTKNADLYWDNVIEKIQKELRHKAVTIVRWKFSREIATQSTFLEEVAVENHLDDYILTDDNYKILYQP